MRAGVQHRKHVPCIIMWGSNRGLDKYGGLWQPLSVSRATKEAVLEYLPVRHVAHLFARLTRSIKGVDVLLVYEGVANVWQQP